MNKIRNIIISVGFLLVGIFMIVFSVIALKAPKGEYAACEAVIVEITEEQNFDETNYHVFVDYTVDGVTYSHKELGSYSSKMKVGDKTEIMYDVSDPENFYSEGAENVPYITLGAGILGVIVAIVIGFKAIVRP